MFSFFFSFFTVTLVLLIPVNLEVWTHMVTTGRNRGEEDPMLTEEKVIKYLRLQWASLASNFSLEEGICTHTRKLHKSDKPTVKKHTSLNIHTECITASLPMLKLSVSQWRAILISTSDKEKSYI